MSDAIARVAPDGLYTPEIKRHSLEKIRLHNRYARIFATAMRPHWSQLAYVGLYAGAGHARVVPDGDTIETSALAVLRQPTRFTHYVFVDHNPDCTAAVESRVAPLRTGVSVDVICEDANGSADRVRASLPPFSKHQGLLSFCFVDPFDLKLKFETIRRLSGLRMDFLVLLMLGVDGRRNFHEYLADPSDTRIGEFIDLPDWRQQVRPNEKVLPFLLTRFDEAMQRVGYLSAAEDAHPIRIPGMGVLLYMLAFYSKSERGRGFWRATRAGLDEQLGFL